MASGAYDLVGAVGVEKLKDNGFSGLAGGGIGGDGTAAQITAPAIFSMLGPAYAKKYGVDEDEFKDVLTRIAWKNHYNGARNPRAQFQKEVPRKTIKASPRVAGQLGIFDCSGVSDGSAAAIICRAEDVHKYTDEPLYVKALSFVAGPAIQQMDPEWDYTSIEEVVRSASDAYSQAGITDPRLELAMAEVHDCFTVTELVLMEDMGFAERGMGWKEVLAGTFDLDGELPVNPDGGLKSFGHPIGAVGSAHAVRVLAAAALQGSGRASDQVGGGGPQARTHPEPRRGAGRVRVVRQRGGDGAGRMSDLVLYEVDGAVATITLNRPDKLNAINWEIVDGLDEAFAAAASDDAVKAVDPGRERQALLRRGRPRAGVVGREVRSADEALQGAPGRAGVHPPVRLPEARHRGDQRLLLRGSPRADPLVRHPDRVRGRRLRNAVRPVRPDGRRGDVLPAAPPDRTRERVATCC